MLLISQTNFTLTWLELGFGTLAGSFYALGRVLLAMAIAEGLAGPAQALCAPPLWHTLWISLFGTSPLTLLQGISILFSVSGIFTISAVDQIISRCKQN